MLMLRSAQLKITVTVCLAVIREGRERKKKEFLRQYSEVVKVKQ